MTGRGGSSGTGDAPVRLEACPPASRLFARRFRDQPGAVQHLRTPGLFEVALLDRRELGVDHHQLSLSLLHPFRDLVDLAGAEERGGPWCRHRRDDPLGDLEFDGQRQPHGLFEAGISSAVGARRRIAVAPVDMQHDGARQLRAFDLEIDAAAGPGGLARGQPPACSSSKRLIGPPGMMVEMACL